NTYWRIFNTLRAFAAIFWSEQGRKTASRPEPKEPSHKGLYDGRRWLPTRLLIEGTHSQREARSRALRAHARGSAHGCGLERKTLGSGQVVTLPRVGTRVFPMIQHVSR